MNREIKFRGLRHDGIDWIFGSLMLGCGECEISDHNDITCGRYDVIPTTVGQYTGLKDINEVEIYEGDILHFQTYKGGGFLNIGVNCYSEVVFGNHNLTDNSLYRSHGFYLLTGKNHRETSIHYWLKSHKAIVVGNIHQHKYLLP